MDVEERIKKAADEIIEHCEAVIILACPPYDSEYDSMNYAYRGSYYSCIGMLEDFKVKKGTAYLQNE